jgi:hypothetical protein
MNLQEFGEKVFSNLGYWMVRLAAPESTSTERPGSPRSDAEQARKWGLKVGDVIGNCQFNISRSICKAITIRYIGDQAIVFDRKEWSVFLSTEQPTSLPLPFGGKEERTVSELWGSTWWLLKPKQDDSSFILEGEEEAKPEEPTAEVGSRDGWVTGLRMTISGPQPTIVSGSLIESMLAVRAAPRDGSDPQRIKTTARYRCGFFDSRVSHLLSAEHHTCLASAHARYQQLLEKVKEKP